MGVVVVVVEPRGGVGWGGSHSPGKTCVAISRARPTVVTTSAASLRRRGSSSNAADSRLPHLSSVLLGHVGVRTTTLSQPAMAAADVARLAQCCPGLQELQLWRQLQPDAELPGGLQEKV